MTRGLATVKNRGALGSEVAIPARKGQPLNAGSEGKNYARESLGILPLNSHNLSWFGGGRGPDNPWGALNEMP